ncbi:MAG: hypothetical protein WDM81_13910 [Rhizomicrobium sp.]
MAFSKLNWQANTAGNGATDAPKTHAYKDSLALATVAASGYFNTVADEIDTGDFVMVNSTATTGGGGKIYRAVNTAGVITLAALS